MYRLLATTVLAGVGVLFAHPALAQDITFSTPRPGTWVESSATFHRLETQAPTTITVEVPTNVSAMVQVAAPTWEGGPSPDPSGTMRSAVVTFSGGTATSTGGPVPLPTGTTELAVSMMVERPTSSGFAPGTYSYQVMITVTTTPP